MHVEDYKLCTICEHVQKNPYLAYEHLKRNHRVEYDANLSSPETLLTNLPIDLFGVTIQEFTKKTNSTIEID